LRVYYDQFEDLLAPVWMLLPINILEWQLERFYMALSTPFEPFKTEDFDNNQPNVAVELEDIIRNWKDCTSIGISLSSIRKHFEVKQKLNDIAEKYTISNIEHLVVRIADIEAVLQMNIRNYYT
jgi:hypothetical protein